MFNSHQHRAIQGGGDGVGFDPPRQLSNYEKNNFMKISGMLIQYSKSTSIGCANDDVNIINSHRKDLEYRLYILKQRQDIPITSSGSTITSHNLHNPQRNELSSITNTNSAPIRYLASEQLPIDVQNSSNLEQCANYSVQSTRLAASTSACSPCLVISPIVSTFIPKLPKSIEECVHLWRFGDNSKSIMPIRLYSNVSSRKDLHKHLSNKKWVGSSQKSCYQRYRAVIKLLTEFAPLTLDMFEAGLDSQWSSAIVDFKEVFHENGKPFSLTTSLKRNKQQK